MATDDVQIARVNLSLPCTVPVLPGTDDETAPIEQRTERCATDAWWFVGRAPICDRHLRRLLPLLGETYESVCAELGVTANEKERLSFTDAYRYPQKQAHL